MEAVSVLGSVAKAAAASVTKKFSVSVLERWSRYRAERFFEAFLEELHLDFCGYASEVDDYLEKLLEDDLKSEVLFDSYRRFCFSQSKTFGPKIIGFLTGRLVTEGRMATAVEEAVFSAAEMFADADFAGFYFDYRTWWEWAMEESHECEMVEKDTVRVNVREIGRDIDSGPFDFYGLWGRWAARLSHAGLLTETASLSVEGARQDDWKDISNEPTTTLYRSLTFSKGCKILSELLSRYERELETFKVKDSETG